MQAPGAPTSPAGICNRLRRTGRGLALVNLRGDLFEADAWNTISAKVQGDRIQLWLNGEEIGAVRIAGPKRGHITVGLQGGPDFRTAELAVREVLVQKIPRQEKKE